MKLLTEQLGVLSSPPYLCWFARLHVWFWLSSTLFDLSVRLGCFFPVVFLLGVVTSGPDNRPGDSLIFDLWPSPEAFWLSLALAFSLPGLQVTRIDFSFMVRDTVLSVVPYKLFILVSLVNHSWIHSTDVIWKVTLAKFPNKYTCSTYQKAPLVSLCSTAGAAGTGVLLDPLGLVLAAVPAPDAALPGEKVSEPWVMEPGQRTRISILAQTRYFFLL